SRTGKAMASTLQISSVLSSASFSGPLHNGQARISSSLVSMGGPWMQPSATSARGLGRLGQQAIELGIEPGHEGCGGLGLDLQITPTRQRECPAFDRILLGHDHWQLRTETQLLQIVAGMIDEWMRNRSPV